MEISFLLPNNKKVKSPYDFQEFREKATFKYYLRLKALEYNEKFVRDVDAFRKEYKVNHEDLYDKILMTLCNQLEKEKEKDPAFSVEKAYFSLMNSLFKEFTGFSFYYYVALIRKTIPYLAVFDVYEDMYANISAIPEIFLFGTVRVKSRFPIIFWTPEDIDSVIPSIAIHIQGVVSKTELKRYIDEVFDDQIKPIIQELNIKTPDTFKLTERDLFILDARITKKLKFREIADLLVEKKIDIETNEDMIKKAFTRAKSKVDSL